MKKHSVTLIAMLLVLILGSSASQFAQQRSDRPDHSIPLGLLRTISTAEVAEQAERGSYVTWDVLLQKHAKYLDAWLATYYSRDSNLHFATIPQVLPGWQVRLNVHSDGQGYDVRVRDVARTPKYAAVSDESGLIWEAEPLH
jgi:hypothetical protein